MKKIIVGLTLLSTVSSFASGIECSCQNLAGCPDRLTVKINTDKNTGAIVRFGKVISNSKVEIEGNSILANDWTLTITRKDKWNELSKARLDINPNNNESLYRDLMDAPTGSLTCKAK